MTVLFDGGVCFDRFGACFTYYTQMAPRLCAVAGIKVKITPSPTGALEVLEGSPTQLLPSVPLRGGKWIPPSRARQWLSRQKKRVEDWRVARQSRHDGKVVFQSFFYSSPPHPSMLSVGMILDMIPEKFNHLYTSAQDSRLRARKLRAIRQAERLIAISRKTKEDLCEKYGIREEKVDVVSLGVHPIFHAVPSVETMAAFREQHVLEWPFFLQVGGRQTHKNFSRLLDAFVLLVRRQDIHLVCVGDAWESYEVEKIKALGLESRVHLMHRPAAGDLNVLYRLAVGLVYPSIYEGFGLPPLEAMACGIPVAASLGGSLPEVVGDAAATFDPYDVEAIADAMEKILDKDHAFELCRRGRDRLALFTWDAIALKTLSVYRKVLDPPSGGAGKGRDPLVYQDRALKTPGPLGS